MEKQKKWRGETRRQKIIEELQTMDSPLSGTKLAEQLNVSRQVIVNDMSLLKARGEPLMATSQGYIWNEEKPASNLISRVVACFHSPEQTEEELLLLVDHGIHVKDVKIEHPVYGDITASVMVKNRKDVEKFMDKIRSTNASFLSKLTDGVHLHTLEAEDEDQLNEAINALSKNGFLLDHSS
ncbi:transcription repressor NadR [Texcoconibacillus texcoconensis]|uniref:Transcription repressor NadR n=1 Tax=Texcoconibacillus texcoconensis TaxID=1095777 RepID=A0A840QSG6_9BACI|nr:transcription repressor NadR [Texcoconibacillus texcoconensis]MBB5174269.1 hypothetical protein [Texcoconibacillus texcoconensis]